MQWISVLKRLPDDDIDVLVYVPSFSESVWVGHFDSEAEVWRWADGGVIHLTVTHWMELPEGPTSELKITVTNH
jgi:hypothetical protein